MAFFFAKKYKGTKIYYLAKAKRRQGFYSLWLSDSYVEIFFGHDLFPTDSKEKLLVTFA